MAQARPNISNELFDLPNNQWKYIIENYLKSDIDKQIAEMYYLKAIPQVEIGAELGYSRSAIRDRLKKIIRVIEKNAKN